MGTNTKLIIAILIVLAFLGIMAAVLIIVLKKIDTTKVALAIDPVVNTNINNTKWIKLNKVIVLLRIISFVVLELRISSLFIIPLFILYSISFLVRPFIFFTSFKKEAY